MTYRTPGPWQCISGEVFAGGSSVRIAKMDRDEPGTFGAERDANAYLIAAAPELLEALEIAVESASWHGITKAREAIRKAKKHDEI